MYFSWDFIRCNISFSRNHIYALSCQTFRSRVTLPSYILVRGYGVLGHSLKISYFHVLLRSVALMSRLRKAFNAIRLSKDIIQVYLAIEPQARPSYRSSKFKPHMINQYFCMLFLFRYFYWCLMLQLSRQGFGFSPISSVSKSPKKDIKDIHIYTGCASYCSSRC